MKTSETGTPKKIDEESFSGIISVVSRKNGRVAIVAAELTEPVVTELTGGFFNALMVLMGVVERVERNDMKGYIVTERELAYEKFVAVAITGAQMKIAMCYGEGEACRVHEVGEDDRIDSATNSQQHLLPRGEEVLLTDVVYEVL